MNFKLILVTLSFAVSQIGQEDQDYLYKDVVFKNDVVLPPNKT
jgi:hypothetical protein